MRLLRLALTAALLACATPAGGQAENPLAPLDTSSPRATLQSLRDEARSIEGPFLAYREQRTVAAGKALLRSAERTRRLVDVSAVPPALQRKAAGEALAYIADILLRLPEIPLETVPGGGGALPSRWTIPGTEIRIVRLEQGERAGEYLFSPETLARLPEFHARIIGLPPLRPTPVESWYEATQAQLTGPLIPSGFVERLPASLQTSVLGSPAWKGLFAVTLLAAILAAIVLWARMTARLSRRAGPVQRLLVRLTNPALLAGLAVIFLEASEREINLSGRVAEAAEVAGTLAHYVAAAWAAWLALHLLAEAIIASPQIPDASYDANLLRLLARVVGFVAACSVLVWGAGDIGIPALGLVAGLGVGGIAVALASQPTLENLFAGIAIFADRPFRIGDRIRFGAATGTVEAIGPRSCRIRGDDGTITAVPNSDLARAQVTNFAERTRCAFRHRIALGKDTPPARLTELLAALEARLAAHPMIEKGDQTPRVRVVGLGAQSIDVDLEAHVLTTDWNAFLTIQQDLILDLLATVEAAGIRLS